MSSIARPTTQKSPAATKNSERNDVVLITTDYVLAPGAPLKKPVDGYDNIVIPLTDGTLRNESKAAGQPFMANAQQVFLMPRQETYLLRNVGDKPLRLFVIELRQAEPSNPMPQEKTSSETQ